MDHKKRCWTVFFLLQNSMQKIVDEDVRLAGRGFAWQKEVPDCSLILATRHQRYSPGLIVAEYMRLGFVEPCVYAMGIQYVQP